VLRPYILANNAVYIVRYSPSTTSSPSCGPPAPAAPPAPPPSPGVCGPACWCIRLPTCSQAAISLLVALSSSSAPALRSRRGLHQVQFVLERPLVRIAQLIAAVLHKLLHLVVRVIRPVARLDLGLAFAVFFCVCSASFTIWST